MHEKAAPIVRGSLSGSNLNQRRSAETPLRAGGYLFLAALLAASSSCAACAAARRANGTRKGELAHEADERAHDFGFHLDAGLPHFGNDRAKAGR